MKYLLSICAVVLLTIFTASAQVASHAPTQLAAPQRTTSQPSGKPVARVNGTVLTDRDLQREMFTMFPYALQHNGNIPPEMEPQIRSGAMKMIIFEELVYQDALRRKMTVSPERLNRAEADFRKQFATPSRVPTISEYRVSRLAAAVARKDQALAVDRSVAEGRGG